MLCCTSTLAWGVNLPAHAVVIKGTQVYDSSRGAFVDLSVLDVLQVSTSRHRSGNQQIFGRAGRPGYETSGEGYICTSQEKLDHYLYAIMAQVSISFSMRSLLTSTAPDRIQVRLRSTIKTGLTTDSFPE